MTFTFMIDEAPKKFMMGQRFQEMKYIIMPRAPSAMQDNSDFMNKIKANYLILSPSTRNKLFLSFRPWMLA